MHILKGCPADNPSKNYVKAQKALRVLRALTPSSTDMRQLRLQVYLKMGVKKKTPKLNAGQLSSVGCSVHLMDCRFGYFTFCERDNRAIADPRAPQRNRSFRTTLTFGRLPAVGTIRPLSHGLHLLPLTLMKRESLQTPGKEIYSCSFRFTGYLFIRS